MKSIVSSLTFAVMIGLLLCLLEPPLVLAQSPQTGLAMICTAPAAGPVQAAACAAREYAVPIAGQLVLACNPAIDTACLPGTASAQPAWSDVNFQFMTWPVPGTYGFIECAKPLVAGVTFTTADPCTPSEDDVNKPLVLASAIVSAPLPVTPTPVTPTPTTGTPKSTFHLTWLAPTQDSQSEPIPTVAADGSTNAITGYLLFQGSSATSLAQVQSLPASALSATVTALAPGAYFFGVEAVNAQGPSGMSNTPEAQVSVVLGPPNPPVVQGQLTISSQ